MCCVLTMVEVNQLLFVESFAGVILKYNFGHAHNYRYVYMKILSALDLSIVNTTQNSYIQNIRQIIISVSVIRDFFYCFILSKQQKRQRYHLFGVQSIFMLLYFWIMQCFNSFWVTKHIFIYRVSIRENDENFNNRFSDANFEKPTLC